MREAEWQKIVKKQRQQKLSAYWDLLAPDLREALVFEFVKISVVHL